MKKKLTLKKFLDLHTRIINFLVKKGKRGTAIKIINSSFLKICKISQKPLHYILIKFFILLNIFVETKTIKVRRSRYIVPFPLNIKRRIYLSLKWFVFVVKKDKKKVKFSNKFIKEMLLILRNKKSEVFKLKILNNSRALQNRSNIHYRW